MLWLLALAAAQDLCDPPGAPSLRALGEAVGWHAVWNGTGAYDVAVCVPTLPQACGSVNATVCRRATAEAVGMPTSWTWRPKAEVWGGPEDAYGILFQTPAAVCTPLQYVLEVVFINGTGGRTVDRDDPCSARLLWRTEVAFLPEPAAGAASAAGGTAGGAAGTSGGGPAGGAPPAGDGGDGGDGDVGLALGVGVGGGAAMLCALLAVSTVTVIALAAALVLSAVLIVACAAGVLGASAAAPASILVLIGLKTPQARHHYVRPLGPDDRLELLEQVGEGSFGKVYRAHLNETVVAVKVIQMGDGAEVALEEIGTMGRVGPHPYVVHLIAYRLDEEAREAHLVLDWCAGGPLYDRKSEEAERWAWMIQITLALVHIHRAGVLHRDLALRNVLLDEHDRARVADFGLGRSSGGRLQEASGTGPIRWMAPEAILRGESSFASDVYMLGALAWEMWSGLVPWANLGADGVRRRAAEAASRPLPPTGYDDADVLIAAMTQADPSERPTVEEVLAAVRAVHERRWGPPPQPAAGCSYGLDFGEFSSSDLVMTLSIDTRTS